VPAPPAPAAAGYAGDRLLGISWTWYGEGMETDVSKPWVPTLKDHANERSIQ
jgi:hypothetical protein